MLLMTGFVTYYVCDLAIDPTSRSLDFPICKMEPIIEHIMGMLQGFIQFMFAKLLGKGLSLMKH